MLCGCERHLPEQIRLAFKHLHSDVQAKVNFVSFEPMLGMILHFESSGLLFRCELDNHWATDSGKEQYHAKIEWVRDLVDAADRAGVPVFLQDNMMPLLKVLRWNPAPYWTDNRP